MDFENHDDTFTLHYPGPSNETTLIQMLRTHAWKFRGLPVPAYAIPAAPLITSIKNGNQLCWRGAVAAGKYSVERSVSGSGGPWTVICDQCATDFDTPWVDKTKPSGTVYYRVRGYSVDGKPGSYSPVYTS